MNCQQFFNFCPPFLFMIILMWSYDVYVIKLCIKIIKKTDILKATLYLTIYHILIFMYIWSFFKTMLTKIGTVPSEFKMPTSFYNLLEHSDTENQSNELLLRFCKDHNLNVITRTEEGSIRFCNICKQVKPDRAHHCSNCEICVLKMDHHCGWINNCVGLTNYKYFLLILIYGSLYSSFFAITILEYFIQFSRDRIVTYYRTNIVLGFSISFTFACVFIPFTCWHLVLVAQNKTTIESLYKSQALVSFNKGLKNNFIEVFGDKCLLALIPINTNKYDGINYNNLIISQYSGM